MQVRAELVKQARVHHRIDALTDSAVLSSMPVSQPYDKLHDRICSFMCGTRASFQVVQLKPIHIPSTLTFSANQLIFSTAMA